MVVFYMIMPFLCSEYRSARHVSKTGFDHGFMDEILWCINSLNGSSVIRCFFCIFLVVVSHHSVELSRLTIESGHY